MGRVSDLSERILIRLVQAGEWEIDAKGRIWRVAVRKGNRWGRTYRVIPCERRRVEHRTPRGYLQARATINGRRYHGGAHRLVWQYFNGDIPPGYEINHDNGLKDDNRPSNLLCGSSGANVAHAHRGGLIDQTGERNPAAKLRDNEVAQIRLAYSKGGYTMEQLGKRFGISFQHVSRLVRGQRRAKQGGPTEADDHRYIACGRDSLGRFRSPDAGIEHNDSPRTA